MKNNGPLDEYVARYHERSDFTKFPTVRECARALDVRQRDIETMTRESSELMIAAYGEIEKIPLGRRYVEPSSFDLQGRRCYGITEIASATGIRPGTIRQWLWKLDHNQPGPTHNLPTPDERLATGPVWFETGPITAWIRDMRQEQKPLSNERSRQAR